MSVTPRLMAATLSLGIGIGSPVEAQNALPALAIAPYEPPIMSVLLGSKNGQLFANILRTSELTREDLGENEVTFLVPRDATCSATERARLESLTSKDAARSYVLSHVIEGSLAVMRDDAHDSSRALFISYWPHGQNMGGTATISTNGRLTIDTSGLVRIDEAHPFDVPLLSGGSVLLSVESGAIHVGSRSAVLDNFSGGRKVDLDECAVF